MSLILLIIVGLWLSEHLGSDHLLIRIWWIIMWILLLLGHVVKGLGSWYHCGPWLIRSERSGILVSC